MPGKKRGRAIGNQPHHHLHGLLDGRKPGGRKPHWHHVLGIIGAVVETRTAASTTALRRVAKFTGKLDLDHRHGMPHSMPPEEMLRMVASQELGRRDRTKHRAVLKHVAAKADRESVREVAKKAGSRKQEAGSR